ncbi:MAG TPA: PAS domain S-box protein [Candidatus Deferrimicrobiaceae bacterium]|jgi:PAS domain S-box-containing protein
MVERRASDRRRSEVFRLDRILLDNLPCPALLIRPGSREIVAANRTAMRVGAEPGLTCYAGWRKRASPCPWCRAPELWASGEPQKRTIEIDERVEDACWAPLDGELYLHYAFDVTEHRRMERSLRDSERQFEDTFRFAAAGIVHIAPGGRFLKANPRYCEITGYTADELLGMTFQEITHPDDLANDLAVSRRIFRGEVDTVSNEKRYVRKDGRVVWVNRITSAVRSAAGGRVNYLVVVVEEIEARKRAEQALRQSLDQLRKLSTHIQEAVEAERKRIAREIHDILGQGLMGLRLDTSWVSDNLGGAHPFLRERLTDMLALIDSTIGTVKRISTELRPVMLDDLGLGPAIEWQAGEFQRKCGIACKTLVSPRDIVLDQGQSTALFRIFREALANIGLHARATRVSVRLAETKRAVTLTVRDDGIGIPAEKICDPASLGLIGMRERLHHFGGTLEIGAAHGGGTALRARLPRDGAPRA